MKKYELLNIFKKKKGVQLHIFEVKEKCIRMIYVDYKMLNPMKNECCPEQLVSYINNHKDEIETELAETLAV